MSLLILGSVATDSVKTNFGKSQNALGGAAVYASIAASNFVNPAIVGVVGKDFPKKWFDLLSNKGIDLSALSIEDGKTFH